MSRSRRVSVDMVLARAMQQFQRHGYYATSIQELVDCTGVGRGSLYNTFDSKRGLFITALRHYIKIHQQRLNALLDQPSPRAATLSVFENLIEGPRDGCFLVNTSVELSPHDREIAQIVSETFHEIEQFFLRSIGQGQAAGEILHAGDSALTAQGLIDLYIALCVLVRSGSDQSSQRDVVRLAAGLLTDPNPT